MPRRSEEMPQGSMTPIRLVERRNKVQIPPDGVQRGRRLHSIRRRYAQLLRRYLFENLEEVLLEIYELGREAVVDELGLLSIAEMHHEAMGEIFSGNRDIQFSDNHYRMAGVVLSEFLSAYEMTSRGYREASTAMRHLNEMLEDEIRRIAHAIHDGAGQYLACVHISLYAIAKHVDDEGKKELRKAHELLDELERDLRRISHELRPRVLENSGLSGAVEFLADSVIKRTGLAIHVEDRIQRRLPSTIETALYRCIQELLNNAVKHAHASNVWILLEERRHLIHCEVRDDGVGFDASAALVHEKGSQLGFLGIKERVAVLGGGLEIESSRGRGVRVVITLPAQG